jgi:hypothetical protein
VQALAIRRKRCERAVPAFAPAQDPSRRVMLRSLGSVWKFATRTDQPHSDRNSTPALQLWTPRRKSFAGARSGAIRRSPQSGWRLDLMGRRSFDSGIHDGTFHVFCPHAHILACRSYIRIETRPRLSISDPFFPCVTQRRLVQILDVDPVVTGISALVAKRQAMPLADRVAHPALSSKTREFGRLSKGPLGAEALR